MRSPFINFLIVSGKQWPPVRRAPNNEWRAQTGARDAGVNLYPHASSSASRLAHGNGCALDAAARAPGAQNNRSPAGKRASCSEIISPPSTLSLASGRRAA